MRLDTIIATHSSSAMVTLLVGSQWWRVISSLHRQARPCTRWQQRHPVADMKTSSNRDWFGRCYFYYPPVFLIGEITFMNTFEWHLYEILIKGQFYACSRFQRSLIIKKPTIWCSFQSACVTKLSNLIGTIKLFFFYPLAGDSLGATI